MLWFFLAVLFVGTSARPQRGTGPPGVPAQRWSAKQFKSLITFGDSYTDENRFNYFLLNNGSSPPPGAFFPQSLDTYSGGRLWARYVVQYTGHVIGDGFIPQMTLYDYAVSGAVCSNLINPRYFLPIGANLPSVIEDAIPEFLTDRKAVRNRTNTPYFTPALSHRNAVYVMWIGTNDLGVHCFITDSQVPGKTLTDYTRCVFAALDTLYSTGARYFVVNNVIPLQLTPLYANDSSGGIGPNLYWTDKPDSHNSIAELMTEYVTSVNTIFEQQIPNEVYYNRRYPNARFALFDVYSLIMDIYKDPTAYLNGSAPANVTGFDRHCDLSGTICTESQGNSPDSFLWYDELHPSEQTHRIIAKEFVEILDGKSKYASYY